MEIKKPFLDTIDPNAESIWQILAVFLREMDSCYVKLETAIDQNDVTAARAELHQMIGATGILNDVELAEILQTIQKIVKSDQPIQSCKSFLLKIKAHLDQIFLYSYEMRPGYRAHFILQKGADPKITAGLQSTVASIRCSQSNSVNDAFSYIKSNEVDIILIDCEEKHHKAIDLSKRLSSDFIDSSILLMVEKPEAFKKEIVSNYQNINGSIHHDADLDEWVKAIKTIVNGRDYWSSFN